MDQRVQCPVCTLYLHSGMSLASHLDTHPKDQVIKALCNLSAKNGNFLSRSSTPANSERSYRSRSRTPATDDCERWRNPHRSSESDRYWRRTPSRSKATPLSSNSRNPTPDIRMVNMSYENINSNNQSSQCPDSYTVKSDKTQQTYGSHGQSSISDFDQQYPYYPEQHDDTEIKFSRSSEYNAHMEQPNDLFGYSMPGMGPSNLGKIPTPIMQPVPRRGNNSVKIIPKQRKLVKSNMGEMQYMPPGVKPMHVMMPAPPPFVQKNLIVSGKLPGTPILDSKSMTSTINPLNNNFNQLGAGAFTPGTTVVTQNSQIIYREMVRNLDGKPFIPNLPPVIGGPDSVTNVAQSSSLYQNVMVVDQYGKTSCMYKSPQRLIPKSHSSPMSENTPYMQNRPHKSAQNIVNEANKTIIIEVTPILPPALQSVSEASQTSQLPRPNIQPVIKKIEQEKHELKIESPGLNKGLKILSNIKVEVPVQHHKNMLNTVMDLTGSIDSDYSDLPLSPDKILPDLESKHVVDDCTQHSNAVDSTASNTFIAIKNTSNQSFKDSPKSSGIETKLDTEFSDSCPVPDLICNEKPSISPCSELSEHGDNPTERTILSPKPESSQPCKKSKLYKEIKKKPSRQPKSNLLKLNNIYVKKNKKVLQIKNSKLGATTSIKQLEEEPRASSSCRKSPEKFSITKLHQAEVVETKSTLQTIHIEKIKDNDDDDCKVFDANTEEQSMDIEPITPSNVNHSHQFSTNVHLVSIKEEINSSNEFSNETNKSSDIMTMATLRPINVINYSNMADFDDDSNHRELLELEAASKNKQFVSMINENYFGDNIYADYFTPDRGESFEAQKESGYGKDMGKEGMYVWGEPSQKESEFVLPNFIHESYKIAESNGVDYSVMAGDEQIDVDGDRCERDSKADLLSESRSEEEPTLNICADEKMPPRGELSGQESNGDMESPWSGMYSGVPPTEPYDLIARESWVSDGSDIDVNEKVENLEEDLHFPKPRVGNLLGGTHNCVQCGNKFESLKELRAHKSLVHAIPTCSNTKTTYSRLITARAIKKEEKPDEQALAGSLLSLDSKETIASMYNFEAKPQILGLLKQENKKRRKDFICQTCKVDQVTEVAFHSHLKIHPLECLTCGKCFFRRANLALHVKTHLGIKNYKCEICEKRFITRQKLNEHHNIHTGRMPVKCTICDDTFRRFSNMVQHRNRHHFKKKAKVRDFVCHCGAVFHSRAKLIWHKETHDEKPKACLYCSDKFVHAASLTRHVRRSHNEYFLTDKEKLKGENVPCPVCKQMYLRSNIRAHLITHSGKRPFSCIICNKAFTTKWNLKLHRWTHLSRSAKPYKCNLCKGAFIRHTEYVSHMNAHKSVRPYTCNYCGCQFIRKYNCQRHVREHEMAKKYVCKVPECGKSFHRSYYLSEHMKVHSGVRPFSCNICGKTSSNKSNHNKHVKIHHAREPVATEA